MIRWCFINMLLAHAIEFQLAMYHPHSSSMCTNARMEGPRLTLVVEAADIDNDDLGIDMQWTQAGA